MALTTCEDCGKDVSTLAPACPHCGRPAGMVDKKIRDRILAGERILCSDGTCVGSLGEDGNCRVCGKSYTWVEDDGLLISNITEVTIPGDEWRTQQQYGHRVTAMLCPHCATKGGVRTKPVTLKKGISGGKATAAIFTGGLSLFATGLSRKEENTQAHCSKCGNTWTF